MILMASTKLALGVFQPVVAGAMASSSSKHVTCSHLIGNSKPKRIVVNQHEVQLAGHQHKLHNLVTEYLEKVKGNASVSRIEYGGDGHNVGNYTIAAYLESVEGTFSTTFCVIIDYIIEEVDECSSGNHRCHVTAKCSKTSHNYECTCDSLNGYFGTHGSGGIYAKGFDGHELPMHNSANELGFKNNFMGQWEGGFCGGESTTQQCCGRLCQGKCFSTVSTNTD